MTDWLTGIAATASALIAGLSLCYAHRANKRAQAANRLAETANQHSLKANRLSETANGIAVEANEIARDAKTIGQRDFELRHERHNVRWELHWEEPGVAAFTNIGDDEAREVAIELMVDGAKEVRETDSAKPHVPIQFLHNGAREQHRLDQVERERRETAEVDPVFGYRVPLESPIDFMHHVSWRVDWLTELGQPRFEERNEGLSDIEPDD